jgi:hypothetical protein
MERCGPETPDHAAALCVKAYRVLERAGDDPARALDVIRRIEARPAAAGERGIALRWRVSLAYVKARLLQAVGRLGDARDAFAACGRMDVRGFEIHLATKTTEACFQAGRISLALGDREAAREAWTRGAEQGAVLLTATREDILVNPGHPNLFNHGDGVREFALAWDSVARCANGLHLLHGPDPVDMALLDASFQHEYATVQRDLVQVRARHSELVEHARAIETLLGERSATLERVLADSQREIAAHNRDLAAVRAELAERTRYLEGELATKVAAYERLSAELAERTNDVVAVRADLVDRTRRLEAAVAHPWKHAYRIWRGKPIE